MSSENFDSNSSKLRSVLVVAPSSSFSSFPTLVMFVRFRFGDFGVCLYRISVCDSCGCEFEQRSIMDRLLLLLVCGNFSLAGNFCVHVFMINIHEFFEFFWVLIQKFGERNGKGVCVVKAAATVNFSDFF